MQNLMYYFVIQGHPIVFSSSQWDLPNSQSGQVHKAQCPLPPLDGKDQLRWERKVWHEGVDRNQQVDDLSQWNPVRLGSSFDWFKVRFYILIIMIYRDSFIKSIYYSFSMMLRFFPDKFPQKSFFSPTHGYTNWDFLNNDYQAEVRTFNTTDLKLLYVIINPFWLVNSLLAWLE